MVIFCDVKFKEHRFGAGGQEQRLLQLSFQYQVCKTNKIFLQMCGREKLMIRGHTLKGTGQEKKDLHHKKTIFLTLCGYRVKDGQTNRSTGLRQAATVNFSL